MPPQWKPFDLIGDVCLPERDHKAGADPVDLVRARLPPDSTGDSEGSTAAILMFLLRGAQRFARATKRRRRTDALDKSVDAASVWIQISSASL